MHGNGVRRPLPWLLLALLVVFVLISLGGACQMPGSSTSSSGVAPEAGASSSAEAERTRAMEEKAAEIERKAEEIRNMEGTEQEKIDAVNALDEERRELQRMQDEGGSAP